MAALGETMTQAFYSVEVSQVFMYQSSRAVRFAIAPVLVIAAFVVQTVYTSYSHAKAKRQWYWWVYNPQESIYYRFKRPDLWLDMDRIIKSEHSYAALQLWKLSSTQRRNWNGPSWHFFLHYWRVTYTSQINSRIKFYVMRLQPTSLIQLHIWTLSEMSRSSLCSGLQLCRRTFYNMGMLLNLKMFPRSLCYIICIYECKVCGRKHFSSTTFNAHCHNTLFTPFQMDTDQLCELIPCKVLPV